MARTPSEAELQTQLNAVIKIFNEIHKFGYSNSPNLITLQDTLEQALEGDHTPAVASSVAGVRSAIASGITPARVRAALDPLLLTYCKVFDLKASSGTEAIIRLYKYFIDNSKDVNGREFTFGTPTAYGSNVGSGTIRRLTVDADNMPIEVGLPEAMRADCVADQGSVDIHREQFEFRTADASIDGLEKLGTGLSRTIAGVAGEDSLVRNASFSYGTSATSLDDWDFDAGAVATTTKDTTNYYRSAGPSDTTPAAINLGAQSVTLAQHINENRIKLYPDRPYYLQLAWNRSVGSAEGTLAIYLGAATTNVAVAAQSGWQVLYLPATAANCWWKGYKENDLDVKIAWTRTAGNLLIDEVILCEWTPFRGQYYVVAGGATPFLLRDYFTWTDTATEAINQYWIQYAYGLYLPTVSDGSETWADPT